MDRGAWLTAVHGVVKSRTRLSVHVDTHTHTHTHTCASIQVSQAHPKPPKLESSGQPTL